MDPKLKSINNIADKILNIKNLQTQNSDQLDLHNIPIWKLQEALSQAYEEGMKRMNYLHKTFTI